MFYFRSFTTGMWVYLFLHGTYGMAWVYKDIKFPDSTFLKKGSIGSNVLLFIFLCLYWMIPVPLASGYGVHNPSVSRIILVITMYLSGLYLMMGSDHQKTTTLAKRKGIYTKFIHRTYLNRLFQKHKKSELSRININLWVIRNMCWKHFFLPHIFLM